MQRRFVFGFLLVYLAVMLVLLPSLNHAVFYGDLTRVGHLPESSFGWKAPQPAIDAADLYSSTLAQADVLVIGDSFSASHRWQSVLARQGIKIHTLTWGEVGDSLCADRVDWLIKQGLRRNSIIIAQSVQRELMARVAHSLQCPAGSNLPALSGLTRQADAPPIVPPGEWLNPDGNLFVGLNTWMNGYRTLSCQDCQFRPWRARHAVRIANVPQGCSYFSHRSCTQALFLQDDRQRLPLDLALVEEIAAVTRRIETQRILWLVVPEMPTDLFAVCGHICRIAGVLGFFDPSPYAKDSVDFQFVFTRTFRDYIDEVAWRWRGGKRGGPPNDPRRNETDNTNGHAPPQEVQELWDILLQAWDDPINCGHYVHTKGAAEPPCCWRAALALMMIADLVFVRVFRDPMKRFNGTAFGDLLFSLYELGDRELKEIDAETSATSAAPRGPASLTFLADTSIVCVMPKIRVAAVGATIRNVSRNLSILPGRGEMRCFWDMTDAEPDSEDKETLDILLIPAPFKLAATDFVAQTNNDGSISAATLRNDKPNWENFHVKQSWIDSEGKRKKFLDDCVALVDATSVETRAVNGIILPEYALDHALFDALCKRLKAQMSDLEFVVSGSSDNCNGQKANSLLTRIWQKREPDQYITNSRRKHHRWRLDRRQIESYGLGTALNPKVSHWWETTTIGQRELYFHRFRTGSTFAALICEELARSDVCHEVLRAVGPNLVFALLMDSAQIPSRWSAQYAASLADDPGCAVLSFTSFGLVERANRLRTDGNSSVALWKDDTGTLVQIPMPEGDGPRGILLSLWSEHVLDQTITGKRSQVRSWRYSSHAPILPK